jgi:AraC family transcriptional regulator of arabinose operon
MVIADGFPGQRLFVLPRPRVQEALEQPGTRQLLVTDCGYFPEARAHGLKRTEPIDQAVIIVCTSGRGWCTLEGVTHAIERGQVLVLPPGLAHAYGSEQDDPWTLWWLHVNGTSVPELLDASGFTAASPVRTVSDVYRLVALIEEVVQQLERDLGSANSLAASGAAWHLLALLTSAAGASTAQSTVIDRAKSYLRGNLADRVSVTELAAMARLSPSHFATLFRTQVGLPVLQYQTQLRMARARELLDTTDLPVARISASIGYVDPFYFSRQFRAVHGTTALRYRAQHKG